MRSAVWLVVLAAGAAACSSPPLVDRSTDRETPYLLRVSVPEVEAEDAEPSPAEAAEIVTVAPRSTFARERAGRDRDRRDEGRRASHAPLRDVVDDGRVDVPGVPRTWAPDPAVQEASTGPAASTAPSSTAGSSAPPPSYGAVAPAELRRSGPSPYVWLLLPAALILLGAVLSGLRRRRANSRLRARSFDPEEAWSVFQAQLDHRDAEESA